MGLFHADQFTTLDGVAQAPQFGNAVGGQVESGTAVIDVLLLGRRTYDIFASYWPNLDSGIEQLFNRISKYVASRQSLNLEWDGSSQLGGDMTEIG